MTGETVMIPTSVIEVKEFSNPYGTTKVGNKYLYHEEDCFPLLRAIFEGKVPYTSDAYSLLANSMERFYKGILIELSKIYSEDIIVPINIDASHRFTGIIQEINKKIPISKSKEGYYVILDNCNRIQKGYTNAKYHDYYEKSDYDKDFRRFTVQRERLFSALNAERIKYEAKDVIGLPEEKEDDDLSYWI